MLTKIVFRLLDADGALVGWVEHEARARGDGQLWSTGPVTIVPDRSAAAPILLSTHWCDVNVETRVPLPGVAVTRGIPVSLFTQASPILRVGAMPGLLPAVTVRRAVVVSVPCATLAAAGTR